MANNKQAEKIKAATQFLELLETKTSNTTTFQFHDEELKKKVILATEGYVEEILHMGLIPPWIKQDVDYRFIRNVANKLDNFKSCLAWFSCETINLLSVTSDNFSKLAKHHAWALDAYMNRHPSLTINPSQDKDYSILKLCTEHWCHTIVHGDSET